MSASISIHNAHEIRARAGHSMASPVTITTVDNRNQQRSEVVLFTDDIGLSIAIADAINAAVEAHKAKKKEIA